MDKLDYELHHASGAFSRENEIVFIPENQVSGKEEQEKVIEFSNKIVSYLENTIKAYNSKYSKKLKSPKLKKCIAPEQECAKQTHPIQQTSGV